MLNKSPEAFSKDVQSESQLLELYILITITMIQEKWVVNSSSSLFTLLQLFSDVAYKARDREDLIAGIDEFLDEVIVLPPGEWDPKIRIEPPKKVPSADKRSGFYHPPL